MKPDKQFASVLRRSREAVWTVASLLHSRGKDVRVKPGVLTPSRERRYDFVDSGDLEVVRKVETERRIEVKWWQDKSFTGAADFPYPEIIVDERYKIEKLEDEQVPFTYFILSADATTAAVINSDTMPQWSRSMKHDRVEGAEREFFFAPLSCCTWVKIPEELRP